MELGFTDRPAWMDSLVDRYEQLLDATLSVAAIILILLTVIVMTNIVLRPFGESVRWINHTAQLMLIWITFLTLGLLAYREDHLRINFFYNRFPSGYKPIHDKLELGANLFLAVVVCYAGYLVTSNTFGGTTATGVPNVLIYSPVPIGMFLLVVVYAGRLTETFGVFND